MRDCVWGLGVSHEGGLASKSAFGRHNGRASFKECTGVNICSKAEVVLYHTCRKLLPQDNLFGSSGLQHWGLRFRFCTLGL